VWLRGTLLPLLWSLVVNELIGLNENGHYTLGYADDIAILIRGKFPKHRLRISLGGFEYGTAVYKSTKDVTVPFTQKRFKGPEGTNPLWTHY